MFGDWDAAMRLSHNLHSEIVDASKKALMIIGLKAEKIAKLHINRQDLNWQPLNKAYKARKEKQGDSNLILVKKSQYIQSITSYVVDLTAFAGVKRSAVNKEGKEIANIAAVHEYGSPRRGIPERPLWKPTFKEVTTWIEKEKPFLRIFFKQVRSKYRLR